jgi:hypothetical protein
MSLKTWKFSSTNATRPVELTVNYEYRSDQSPKNEKMRLLRRSNWIYRAVSSSRLEDLMVEEPWWQGIFSPAPKGKREQPPARS